MNIVILGAGAWGTALAVSAAQRAAVSPDAANPANRHVTLWARDAAQARAMVQSRENAQYLPGIALPAALTIDAQRLGSLAVLTASADLVVVATPMSGLRAMLVQLRDCQAPVAWLCKGFEAAATPLPARGLSIPSA